MRVFNRLSAAIVCACCIATTFAQGNVAPEVPLSVAFAGQIVELNRFDRVERMDRELLSMMYGHTNTFLTIKRANRYIPELKVELKKHNVPEDFVYLAAVESHFDETAKSPAKAAGFWQFVPTTAREYGLEVNNFVDERYDYIKATKAACRYFKKAYSNYKCWFAVAASYNAGMARISKTIDKQFQSNVFDLYMNDETSRYIYRLLAMKLILENPGKYGFKVRPDLLYQPIRCRTVKITGSIDNWIDWAKQNGSTFYMLKKLNPWICGESLPNLKGKIYFVRLPL